MSQISTFQGSSQVSSRAHTPTTSGHRDVTSPSLQSPQTTRDPVGNPNSASSSSWENRDFSGSQDYNASTSTWRPGDRSDKPRTSADPHATSGQQKKKSSKRKRLTENDLVSAKGIKHLVESIAPSVAKKVKAKHGTELSDIRTLLNGYKLWTHEMFSGVYYEDVLDECTRLGGKAQVRNEMNRFREAEQDKYLQDEDNEDPENAEAANRDDQNRQHNNDNENELPTKADNMKHTGSQADTTALRSVTTTTAPAAGAAPASGSEIQAHQPTKSRKEDFPEEELLRELEENKQNIEDDINESDMEAELQIEDEMFDEEEEAFL